jgi:transposase
VQRAWHRYDRLSVIAAITVSPERRRMHSRFQVHAENIRTHHIRKFLLQLRQELRRPLVVIMDRLPAHRSAARQLLELHDDIEIEWLPGYAPELNPVEALWSHTKYCDLANFLPNDTSELRQAVLNSLKDQRGNTELLQSFFQAAKLTL